MLAHVFLKTRPGYTKQNRRMITVLYLCNASKNFHNSMSHNMLNHTLNKAWRNKAGLLPSTRQIVEGVVLQHSLDMGFVHEKTERTCLACLASGCMVC